MSDNKGSNSSLLEIQEPKTRTSRVEDLLSSSSERPTNTITLPPRSLEELRNAPLPINEDLMQRLRSFLPAMQQSTQELQQQAEVNPSSLDIEHLEPSTQEYIEMASPPGSRCVPYLCLYQNLGLGVYESRPNPASQNTTSDSDESDDTDSSSDSDSDSDSDSEPGPDVLSILMSAVPPVPRVPIPPSRPNIVMLQSSPSPSPAEPPTGTNST